MVRASAPRASTCSDDATAAHLRNAARRGARGTAGASPGSVWLALLPLMPLALTAPCADPVPVYRDGAREGEVCPALAAAAGLTVVDL